MPHFLCRLNGPRSTFPHDMTADEVRLMTDHVAYWTALARDGKAVAFGPVADPKGFWGLAIVEVASETEARGIVDGDPLSRAEAGFAFEIYAMPSTVLREGLRTA